MQRSPQRSLIPHGKASRICCMVHLLCGMFRHPEVQHPASLMREHHEDEQDLEGRGFGTVEKIDGRGLRQMICQKRGTRPVAGVKLERNGSPIPCCCCLMLWAVPWKVRQVCPLGPAARETS